MIIYIFLFSFVCNIFCMEQDSSRELTIITGDDYTDNIDRSLIAHCDLLKKWLEVYPTETTISLPNISKEVWQTVKLCLGYSARLSNPQLSTVQRQKTKLNFAQCVSTQAKLFKLLMAASYLGDKHLCLLCKKAWAKHDYSASLASPSYKPQEYKMSLPYELNLSIALKKKETQMLINDVGIWRSKTIEMNPLTVLNSEQSSVWSNAFNNAGTCLAGGHYNGTLSMYNIESKKIDIIANAHEGKAISMIQFNNDDTQLLSSAQNKTIKIWDLATQQCIHTLSSDNAECFAFSMNPQNTLIVSDAHDHGILLWDVSTIKNHQEVVVPQKIDAHTKSIFAFDFNHGGNLFASASEDKTVKIWNPSAKNPCVCTLDNYESGVMSVYFGKSKPWLASGDSLGNIRVYDIVTQKLLWQAQEHTNGIWAIPFAANDTLLCSGSTDNTVKIWDNRSHSCLKTAQNHTSNIHFMSVDHKNDILASASGDGTMIVWDMRQLAQPIYTMRRYFKKNCSLEKIEFIQRVRQRSQQDPLDITLTQNLPLWNSFSLRAKKILKDNLPLEVPPVKKRKGEKIRTIQNKKSIEPKGQKKNK